MTGPPPFMNLEVGKEPSPRKRFILSFFCHFIKKRQILPGFAPERRWKSNRFPVIIERLDCFEKLYSTLLDARTRFEENDAMNQENNSRRSFCKTVLAVGCASAAVALPVYGGARMALYPLQQEGLSGKEYPLTTLDNIDEIRYSVWYSFRLFHDE